MNKDILKGKWLQLVGGVKQRWADLTDDDIRFIDGSKDKLIGKIQERYGRNREEAAVEVDEFLDQEDTRERRVS
jgi:uncharacterized protein YjbJ (UPF0337 family)